jgi:hypothetical protein
VRGPPSPKVTFAGQQPPATSPRHQIFIHRDVHWAEFWCSLRDLSSRDCPTDCLVFWTRTIRLPEREDSRCFHRLLPASPRRANCEIAVPAVQHFFNFVCTTTTSHTTFTPQPTNNLSRLTHTRTTQHTSLLSRTPPANMTTVTPEGKLQPQHPDMEELVTFERYMQFRASS